MGTPRGTWALSHAGVVAESLVSLVGEFFCQIPSYDGLLHPSIPLLQAQFQTHLVNDDHLYTCGDLLNLLLPKAVKDQA